MRRSRIRPLSMLLAFALVVAACSGDDSSDSAGDASAQASTADGSTGDATAGDDTAGGNAAADDAVLGDPEPASGEPIVIGWPTSSDEGQRAGATEMLAGAEVAVAYQNEYGGGLAGRPIELFTCDLGALPETAVDCANQYVEEGVTAVLVPVASNGASVVPIVTDSGIPYVSFAAVSLEELASPGAFSIAGGGAAGLGVVALDAAERGYETVSHVVIDVPQVTLVATAVGNPLFEAAGITQEVILAPLGVPDLTSQLSTATGDAILVSGDESTCASALRAYQTLALETPLYIQTTCVSEGIARSLPGIYDGTSLASSLANAEEDTELFGAMIDRYDPDNPVPRRPVEAGLFAVGVSTVVSFARALGGLTDPTGPAIMEQMETTGVQSLFLGTPVSFDCGEPILELASSLCSVQGHLVELDADGAAVDSRFFDPTDLFDTALSG